MPRIIISPKSTLKEVVMRYASPEPNTGCWLWMGCLDKAGYGKLAHAGRNLAAHRASYEAFVGPIPDGLLILHRCDNPICCNPEHLRAGTQDENMKDCCSKGRKAKKLTHSQVAKILEDIRPQTHIAKDYGVSSTMISMIKRGVSWKTPLR